VPDFLRGRMKASLGIWISIAELEASPSATTDMRSILVRAMLYWADEFGIRRVGLHGCRRLVESIRESRLGAP